MPDVLIVPGGYGTRQVLEKRDIIEWIQLVSKEAELVLSVCTGSLVLAKAGILEGLQATTHHQVLDTLASLAPNTKIIKGLLPIEWAKLVVEYTRNLLGTKVL